MVVIAPMTMPTLSLNTLAAGEKQLEVQEALETTVMSAVRTLSFTPYTTVASSIVADQCGNEDIFRAAFKVDIGFFFAIVNAAGAFHDQIDTEFFPQQFGRVAGREEEEIVAVDDEAAAVVGYVGFKASVHGVEVGEVGVGFKATAGVDGDDLELVLNHDNRRWRKKPNGRCVHSR